MSPESLAFAMTTRSLPATALTTIWVSVADVNESSSLPVASTRNVIRCRPGAT